ncbi:apolipoprotein A-I-like [Pseudochaenichthys georgianus]|uniref:apolipoprotein A-I-like n=1 Tax=Pseudochaenichthys georgianus TaxID=52239 RepID=UPI0039C458EE
MKVLVVLVLAVFTGCTANILYADAPKPQIELLTEAFWDYAAKATATADDTLQVIKKSPFGRGVNDRLEDTRFMTGMYLHFMLEMLPPATRDMLHKVITEAEELNGHVERELAAAKDIMKVQIQQRVEQLKQKLAPYAESIDTEAVRATLEQKSEELKQSVKDLQAQLEPYTDDLKLKVDQYLQDFQERVAPVTHRVQDQMIQMLHPYVEDLRFRLFSFYEAQRQRNISCTANILYADAPKPQIELLTEAFWDYAAKATETADDTLQMIKKSPFGQVVK